MPCRTLDSSDDQLRKTNTVHLFSQALVVNIATR